MTASLAKYRDQFLALDRPIQICAGLAVIVTMMAISFDFSSSQSTSAASVESEADLDTFIPSGFSLVPIEIANSSGMDSILGRYGTADLYRDGQKDVFMKNVRLVRGIQEDGPWAALVPTPFANDLLAAGGRFFVALKSSKADATEYNPGPRPTQRKIIYGGD